MVRGEVVCASMQRDPESVGLELAERLAADGAREILAALTHDPEDRPEA
jgi:hypothetical protein